MVQLSGGHTLTPIDLSLTRGELWLVTYIWPRPLLCEEKNKTLSLADSYVPQTAGWNSMGINKSTS